MENWLCHYLDNAYGVTSNTPNILAHTPALWKDKRLKYKGGWGTQVYKIMNEKVRRNQVPSLGCVWKDPGYLLWGIYSRVTWISFPVVKANKVGICPICYCYVIIIVILNIFQNLPRFFSQLSPLAMRTRNFILNCGERGDDQADKLCPVFVH